MALAFARTQHRRALGDFKLDLTPIDGRRTDHLSLAPSRRGRRVVVADSTNARTGFNASERSSGALRHFLERPERRMMVACFASHPPRPAIINVALEHTQIV